MKTLATCRAPDFHRLDNITLLLPIGSTEQHSAHLPMGTDATIVEEICQAASALSNKIVTAPTLPYGASEHHRSLPGGSVSIRPRLLVDVIVTLMEQLLLPERNRALLIVNGHGGNWASIACAIDEFGSVHGETQAAACSWWQLVRDAIEVNIGASDPGIGHAGACETSVMLALRPELVEIDLAPEMTTTSAGTSEGGAFASTLYHWRDFARHFPDGVVGTPRAATAQAGQAIIEVAAQRLVLLAEAMCREEQPP